MVYIIIGIVVLVVVIGIIGAAVSWMWKHKGIALAIILAMAAVGYFTRADRPLAFLPVWGQNIKNFLWKITYRHTVFDTIWVYLLLILTVFFVSTILQRLFSRKIVRLGICTISSFAILVLTLITRNDFWALVLTFELLVSVSVLWSFVVLSVRHIGLVKDVYDTYYKIEIPVLQMAILDLVIISGVIQIINDFFDVNIQVTLVPVILFLGYIVIEIKWYCFIFSGYKHINHFVKQKGLFEYSDFERDVKLQYLSDADEYVSSVIDIMAVGKKIYLLPFGNRVYLNQAQEKLLVKLVKSNLSSEEIAAKTEVDFREYGFDAVYKALFAKSKGYEIDFSESEESKQRKKSEVGIGAVEFVMMRYPIKEHPLLNEMMDIRSAYIVALDALVRRGNIDYAKWEAKVEEYKSVFELNELKMNPEEAIKLFSSIIKRKESLFKTIKSDYSYLLLLEAIFFKNLLTEDDISYKEIEKTFEQLKIKRVYRDFVYQYIKAMFIAGDIDKAELLLTSKVKADVRKVLEYIHRNVMWNERYVVSKQYSVAVCATMSAGKSTFINSLLGMDYIPAKNEACTAKVTTIRDNDNLDQLIGCYTRNDGSKVYSNIIDGEVLSAWNDDIDVAETVLEGNIEEVSCDNAVLVIHDTPGTNNSGDESHHDKTMDFIKNNSLDLVIYLINAEYISTTDTELLLKEIQGTIKESNTKIIFGLNKIDAYDEEGNDSIGNAIKGLIEQLKSYGFENPIVFPFSANAARLFKLVIKGKNLTKREKRTFNNLYEYFLKFNASDYVVNAPTTSLNENYPFKKKDTKLIVDDIEYSYNKVIEALSNTGLFNIESWLEMDMKECE